MKTFNIHFLSNSILRSPIIYAHVQEIKLKNFFFHFLLNDNLRCQIFTTHVCETESNNFRRSHRIKSTSFSFIFQIKVNPLTPYHLRVIQSIFRRCTCNPIDLPFIHLQLNSNLRTLNITHMYVKWNLSPFPTFPITIKQSDRKYLRTCTWN